MSVPLCVIWLAPAGHRVADTCTGARVYVLHHDKGMLLQSCHGEVTIIGDVLQEAAVPRPDGVAHLDDPSSVRTNLEREEAAHQYHIYVSLNFSCDLHFMSKPPLFTCFVFLCFTGQIIFKGKLACADLEEEDQKMKGGFINASRGDLKDFELDQKRKKKPETNTKSKPTASH